MVVGPLNTRVYKTKSGLIISIPLWALRAGGARPHSYYCLRLGYYELVLSPPNGECPARVHSHVDANNNRVLIRLGRRLAKHLPEITNPYIFLDGDTIIVRFGRDAGDPEEPANSIHTDNGGPSSR